MSSPRYVDRAAPSWVRALLAALLACAALYAVLLVGGGGVARPAAWTRLVVADRGALHIAAGRVVPRARRAASADGAARLDAARGRHPELGRPASSFGPRSTSSQAAPPYPSLCRRALDPVLPLPARALVGASMKAERPHIPTTAWLDALIPACAVSASRASCSCPMSRPPASRSPRRSRCSPIRPWTSCSWWSTCCSSRCGAGSPTRAGDCWRWPCSAPALGDTLWSYLGRRTAPTTSGSAADLPYVLAAGRDRAGGVGADGRTEPARARRRTASLLLLPAVAAVCALGLLLYGALTGGPDPPLRSRWPWPRSCAGVVRWLIAVRREAQAAVLRDVAAELARKAEQQATVADLGRQAVATGDEERTDGAGRARCVAGILGAERVAVLELVPEGGRELRAAARTPVARAGAATSSRPVGLDALGRGPATSCGCRERTLCAPHRAQGRLAGASWPCSTRARPI